MFWADFHVHSSFSDGQMTVSQLVDFYGSRGFGAIAITDHICEERSFLGMAASYLNYTLRADNFSNYMETLSEQAERAWYQYRMVLLPGFEVSKNSLLNHRSAHILGIGVSEFVSADQTIDSILDTLADQGALRIAAHPVWTRKQEAQTYHLWNRREELSSRVDAWEVASGAVLFDEVLNSGLPMLASSDLHHAKQLRSWKTVLDCERHPQAILQAIRDQDLSFRFYEDENSLLGRHPNQILTRFSGTTAFINKL